MTEPLAEAQDSSMSALPNQLSEPLLYLSSAEAGWEGLVAQAFHEPSELEGWIAPSTSDISLVLLTGGTMHIEQRQGHGSWKGGDVHHGDLILNSGGSQPYEVRWKCLSSVPTQTLHLHLNRDLVARAAQEVIGTDLARLALARRSSFQDPLLTQVALALWRELEQPSPAGNLFAQTAAQLLAVHLVRHYTTNGKTTTAVPLSPPGLTSRQIKQVQDFMLAHLGKDLSLETLAQQIGFSPYHFARLFRKATGASPHQFVLRKRIERAQWLLQGSDMTLADIAGACGFADQSHMTQVFKRALGLTPHAYRQQRGIGRIFAIHKNGEDEPRQGKHAGPGWATPMNGSAALI